MSSLPRSDELAVDAVQGWLMLGDVVSARDEFAQLSPLARARPDVLELEWALHAAGQAWTEAFEAAQRLIDLAPERVSGWIHRAYALRRMPNGGLPRAAEALRPAHDRFPQDFLIAYNLGCYAVQLGRLNEGWDWVELALSLGQGRQVLKMALADPDLEPIWSRLCGKQTP